MIYVSPSCCSCSSDAFGTSVKGAQRWSELFGFQLAPSEVAKLALIAMLAAFLSELRGDLYTAGRGSERPRWRRSPRSSCSCSPTRILDRLRSDPGRDARGRRGSSSLPSVLAPTAVVLIVAGFQVGLVREYQIERLQAFLDPASVSADALHNREQAEIAIGSGGLTGACRGRDRRRTSTSSPSKHTDFVFTVIGEEFGFAGKLVLLGLYGILLYAFWWVALLSRDPFGTCTLAAGSPRCSRCRCLSTSG